MEQRVDNYALDIILFTKQVDCSNCINQYLNIMNKIDNVITYRFKSALELANWIIKNIPNPIRQEQVMMEGVRHYYSYGCYQITVEY